MFLLVASVFLLVRFEIISAYIRFNEYYDEDHNHTTLNEVMHADWTTWCKFQPNGQNCGNLGLRYMYYYDILLDDCRVAPTGNCKFNLNKFDTISDCHSFCRDSGHDPVKEQMKPAVYCRMQPDFGQCNGYYPRFYYDVTKSQCVGFSYSGCGGNDNRFSSFQLCSKVCGPKVSYEAETEATSVLPQAETENW